MPKTKPPDPKTAALREHGCLNPHPDRSAIRSLPVPTSSTPATWSRSSTRWCGACASTGSRSATAPPRSASRAPRSIRRRRLSRRGGLAALVPSKPGPRRSHKLERGGDGVSARELSRRDAVAAASGAGASSPRALRPQGSPAQRRAGAGATGKKTAVTAAGVDESGGDTCRGGLRGATRPRARRRRAAGRPLRLVLLRARRDRRLDGAWRSHAPPRESPRRHRDGRAIAPIARRRDAAPAWCACWPAWPCPTEGR